MELNKQQRALLQDLQRNEIWRGLLRDIETEFGRIPEWKPGGDEAEKGAKWVYESGGKRRLGDLLTLLRLGYEP